MIGEIIATLIGLVAGLLMVKLFPKIFNPIFLISEKAPFFISITLSIMLALFILSGSSTAFYIVLIFAGLAGMLLSYSYMGGITMFGGSGFSRDNVGMALAVSGGLHLLIVFMLLSSPASILYMHTMLPLDLYIMQALPIILLLPILFLMEFFFVALPEELYCRAFLVDGVSRSVGYPIAVATAMGVWVGLHAITRIPAGASVALIPIGAGGLALIWLYMTTRNIGITALAHAVYNTVIDFTAVLVDVDVSLALLFFVFSTLVELATAGFLLLTGEPRVEL